MSERTEGPGWAGRFGPAALVGVLLLGLLLGAGGYYGATHVSGGSSGGSQARCSSYQTVRLAVDPALYGVVVQVLPKIQRPCVTVEATSVASGNSAFSYSQGVDLPDIWIPDSEMWLTRTFLGRASRFRIVDPAVASTPVLLVGGPRAARAPSWGAAETSERVSTPDPLATTAGALALAAPLAEADKVGRTASQAREILVPFAQDYSDRRSRGLDEQVSLASITAHTRRIQVATEQDLVGASSRVRLRVLTPRTGVPVQRFPVAVAKGRSAAVESAARDLAAYLATDRGIALLHESGLRGGDLRPIPGSGAGRITPLPPAPPRSVASRLLSWRTLGVPSSILAVIDASGSMDFSAGAGTRMQLLSDAAALALDFLPDQARVGLWIFSIDKGGPKQDWRVLEPTQRLDTPRFGRTQRSALQARAEQLVGLTGGGTGLYDTALAAYRRAQRDYRKAYSNAVVLMTDGANDDPGSISLPDLIARLKAMQDPDRPVRIIAIGISDDADLGALDRIATATGGKAFLARDPADIATVFGRAVLSR